MKIKTASLKALILKPLFVIQSVTPPPPAPHFSAFLPTRARGPVARPPPPPGPFSPVTEAVYPSPMSKDAPAGCIRVPASHPPTLDFGINVPEGLSFIHVVLFSSKQCSKEGE